MAANKHTLQLWLAFAAICAALVAGCSSAPQSMNTGAGAAPNLSQGILRAALAQTNAINSMRASGTIAVESPSFSNSGSIDVSLRAPDSIRIKITGPFGIPMGSLFAAHGHYEMYNAIENIVQTGTINPDSALPLPGVTLKFGDAYAFLKGEPPELAALCSRGIPDSNANEISVQDGNKRTVECLLDGARIRGARIIQSSGDELDELFSGYAVVDSVNFPKKLTAKSATKGTISIRYDDVSLNTQDVDFLMPSPAGAKILRSQ